MPATTGKKRSTRRTVRWIIFSAIEGIKQLSWSLIGDRQTLRHGLPVVPLLAHVVERGLQVGETSLR
jgi:hypothetical protein